MKGDYSKVKCFFVGYLFVYLAFFIGFVLNYLPYKHFMLLDTPLIGALIISFITAFIFGLIPITLLTSNFCKSNDLVNMIKKVGLPLFIFFIVIFLSFPDLGALTTASTGFYGTSFRSIVARTYHQQHETAEKIDEYKLKTGSYPASQQDYEQLFSSQINNRDPFNNYGKGNLIYIPLSISTQYLIISQGPNTKIDIPFQQLTSKLSFNESFLIPYTYDPSNGIISSGDIWKLGS